MYIYIYNKTFPTLKISQSRGAHENRQKITNGRTCYDRENHRVIWNERAAFTEVGKSREGDGIWMLNQNISWKYMITGKGDFLWAVGPTDLYRD